MELERLERFMVGTGASVVVSRSKSGIFATGAEWGQEAPDSPMAGAAAYGMGDTLAEAIATMVSEAGY